MTENPLSSTRVIDKERRGIRLICYEYVFIECKRDKEQITLSIAYGIRLFQGISNTYPKPQTAE